MLRLASTPCGSFSGSMPERVALTVPTLRGSAAWPVVLLPVRSSAPALSSSLTGDEQAVTSNAPVSMIARVCGIRMGSSPVWVIGLFHEGTPVGLPDVACLGCYALLDTAIDRHHRQRAAPSARFGRVHDVLAVRREAGRFILGGV